MSKVTIAYIGGLHTPSIPPLYGLGGIWPSVSIHLPRREGMRTAHLLLEAARQIRKIDGHVILCGHSNGALLSLALASILPEKVIVVVCIALPAMGLGKIPYAFRPEMLKFAARRIRAMLRTGELVQMTRDELVNVCGMPREMVEHMSDNQIAHHFPPEAGFILYEAIFGLPKPIRKLIVHGEAPVKMFHGTADTIIPIDLARRTAEQLRCELEEVHGLEHLIFKNDKSLARQKKYRTLARGIVKWARVPVRRRQKKHDKTSWFPVYEFGAGVVRACVPFALSLVAFISVSALSGRIKKIFGWNTET